MRGEPRRRLVGERRSSSGGRPANGGRSPSPSRTRTGPGRDAAALFKRRRLIMTGPGRSHARATRPWPRRLRRRGVLETRKPLLSFRLAVVFLLRAPGRRFSALLFQEPPRTTRRPGAGQAPGTGCPRGANHPPRKIARRSRYVSACAACATQAPSRCSTSLRVTVPARQRSRRPRRRLRKRRTFASGSRRRRPASARTRETSPATPSAPRASSPGAATADDAPGTPPGGRATTRAGPGRRRTARSRRRSARTARPEPR